LPGKKTGGAITQPLPVGPSKVRKEKGEETLREKEDRYRAEREIRLSRKKERGDRTERGKEKNTHGPG